MGRNLHHAHRSEGGVPRIARLFGRRRRSGLSKTPATIIGHLEPAHAPALCFSGALIGALAVVLMISDPLTGRCAGENALLPETACAQIRESVGKLAKAERDEALALHLMTDGKPTPVVQTRLTELQAQIGNLRETLRRARHQDPPDNSELGECIQMGFRSLTDAESVSRQIQDLVAQDDGILGPPPPIRSDESLLAPKIRAPGAAAVPNPAE